MIRMLDVVAVGGIVLALMSLADWKYENPRSLPWLKHDFNDHLGAEYDEIAHAIRAGRGFSDPFRAPSGPTAWMPPVLPYLQAGLYWITGDNREAVLEVVLGIKGIVLVFAGLLVVGQARRLERAWLGYLVFPLLLAANYFELFQMTHDTWLVLLVLNLTWLGAVRFSSPPRRVRSAVLWGMFGGVAALCCPIAGAAWAAITVAQWFPAIPSSNRTGRIRALLLAGKPLMIAAVCSLLVVAPWTVRGRVVMGRWIPIKSNVVYEFWQSQCLDNDGVLDEKTTVQHPWLSSGQQRRRYLEVGEIKFIEEKLPEARRTVSAHPWDVAKRISRRFLSVCVDYVPYFFEEADGKRIWPLRFVRTVFPLPVLSILVVLVLRRHPLERDIVVAMWLYAFYLLPYVLVSYTDRYGAALVGIKMLLVLYGMDTVVRHLPWLRPSRTVVPNA